MTKEEYLKLAASKWDALESLKEEKNFYDYEKKFEAIMLGLSREILNEQFQGQGNDRRKKKSPNEIWTNNF